MNVSHSYQELYSTLTSILSDGLALTDFIHRIKILLSRGVDINTAEGNYSFSPLDLALHISHRRMPGYTSLLDLMLEKKSTRRKLMIQKSWLVLLRHSLSHLSDDILFNERQFNLCDMKIRLDHNVSDKLYNTLCGNKIATKENKVFMDFASECEIKWRKQCVIFTNLYVEFMLLDYNKDILRHIIKMLLI